MSFQIILVVHVLLALGLVGLILIQHGKGASAGAGFGSGAAGAVFGARGAHSFLYKLTATLAAAFFITSISLAYLATSERTVDSSQSVMVQTVSEDDAQSDLPTTNDNSSDVPEN
jgi:preprotein translocase subunit SecG